MPKIAFRREFSMNVNSMTHHNWIFFLHIRISYSFFAMSWRKIEGLIFFYQAIFWDTLPMCQTSRCWCDPEVEEDLEWITIVGPGSWSVDIRLLEELILPMELIDDPSSWLNMAGTVSLARPEKSFKIKKLNLSNT